jgi:mannosyltransferase
VTQTTGRGADGVEWPEVGSTTDPVGPNDLPVRHIDLTALEPGALEVADLPPAPEAPAPAPADLSELADRLDAPTQPARRERLRRLDERLDDAYRLLHRGLTRPWAAEFVAGLGSAAWFSWRVGRPSPWWDEAITRDVTSRSSSDIINLVTHVDLVHATYYLLVHALLGSSASITPIRLLSVAAAAITTVLLVRLGRELGSARVGFVAALAWAIAPLASRYAQEGRSYAMVTMAATASVLALVRVARRPWLRSRWVVYAVTLVATGLLNVIALLIVIPQLTYLAATSSRAVRRRWYVAAGGSLALLTPLLVASSRQKEQVSWLPRPGLASLTGFFSAEYAVGITLIVVIALALVGLAGRTHKAALGLGLSWALLPPVVLWTISQAHPLFDWRYVLFALPGTALAIGSLATHLRTRWMAALLVVVALCGAHMQEVYRYTASGHSENIRGAAEVIARNGRPGDAVIFLPASRRVVELGYPQDFAGVDDVALARSGEDSDTLWGEELPPATIAANLKGRIRVWVVTSAPRLGEQPDPAEKEKEMLLYDDYRVIGVVDVGTYTVRLYERDGRVPDRIPIAAPTAS